MPRTHKMPPDLPAGVQSAMNAFNVNSLRAVVIRDLAQHPDGDTTGAIARRVGVDYRQVYAHIRVLLDERLVVRVDGDEGDQSGRRVIYGIDQVQLSAQSEAYARFLAGK